MVLEEGCRTKNRNSIGRCCVDSTDVTDEWLSVDVMIGTNAMLVQSYIDFTSLLWASFLRLVIYRGCNVGSTVNHCNHTHVMAEGGEIPPKPGEN